MMVVHAWTGRWSLYFPPLVRVTKDVSCCMMSKSQLRLCAETR